MLPPLLVLEPWPLPLLALQTRPSGTQTEPQCEPPTSVGIILPETGQFLLLCSLQLWQQLQCCRQTYAKVPLFFIHFTSFLWKQFAANDMFWEANSYK